MKPESTQNHYSPELPSGSEEEDTGSNEDQESSRFVPYLCATLGMMAAIPVIVCLSSAILSITLGSVARLKAGAGTDFDNLLAALGFPLVGAVVLMCCGLPSFALSIGAFLARRDRYTAFALMLAVVPTPVAFLILSQLKV